MLGVCEAEGRPGAYREEGAVSGAGEEGELGVEADGVLEDVWYVWDDSGWV